MMENILHDAKAGSPPLHQKAVFGIAKMTSSSGITTRMATLIPTTTIEDSAKDAAVVSDKVSKQRDYNLLFT